MKIPKIIKDMPHLRKRMERIDKNRIAKLKDAKETKSLKLMLHSIASRQIKNAHTPKAITQLQKNAIYLLCDFSHNYSYEYIASRLGIDIDTLARWRNDPDFIKATQKELDLRMNYMLRTAMQNVFRRLRMGDMKSTWKYLEMTGHARKTIRVEDTTGDNKNMTDADIDARIATLAKELDGESPTVN